MCTYNKKRGDKVVSAYERDMVGVKLYTYKRDGRGCEIMCTYERGWVVFCGCLYFL